MRLRSLIVLSCLSVLVTSSLAFTQGISWRDHLAPFDFLFENEFDFHQQTTIRPNKELYGFLYIRFTGRFSQDGYPVAEMADGAVRPDLCNVGWVVRGWPGRATVAALSDSGLPVWRVDRKDIPTAGAFTTFQWMGGPGDDTQLNVGDSCTGYFLELTAEETFVFREGDRSVLVTPGLDTYSHINILPFP